MRCKNCKERWSLVLGIGPGGAASPGQYLFVGMGLVVAAVLLGIYQGWIIGALAGTFAAYVVLLSVSRCGHQRPTTGYQGSICPKCGADNFIRPWNF